MTLEKKGTSSERAMIFEQSDVTRESETDV